MKLSPLTIALLVAAGFCAYEAADVSRNGLDIFYPSRIEGEYRGEATLKWALGAAALGLGALVVKG